MKVFDESWHNCMMPILSSPYMKKVRKFLITNQNAVTPHPKDIFNAFKGIKFNDFNLVIIGQDPYPQPGYATGVAFAVPTQIGITTSLKNIADAIAISTGGIDYGMEGPGGEYTFDVTMKRWTDQNILLLNAAFTTVKLKVGEHYHIWRPVMEHILHYIAKNRRNVIFCLWGTKARDMYSPLLEQYSGLFDRGHSVLIGPHPAERTGRFSYCDHFREVNKILQEKSLPVIDW